MADTYEVAESVEAVTTAPDGKAVRRRFKAGAHASPTDAERAVLEEVLIPAGLAKRRKSEPRKRSRGQPRKAAKRAQKADKAPPAQDSAAEAPSVAQEAPSGSNGGSGAQQPPSQEEGHQWP